VFRGFDDFDDREAKGARECVVAAVMCWHRHDDTSAIAHQDIVCDPYGNRRTGGWIGRESASEHSCFGPVLRLFNVAERLCLSNVFVDRVTLRGCCNPGRQRMLRRHDDKGRTPDGIRPRRVDRQRFPDTGNGEGDLRALGPSDPVPLHCLDALWPIEFLKVFQESVGIGCDLQHPLAHQPPFNGFAGLDIFAVFDLFVGQNRTLRRTPVHCDLGLIGKAALEQFQEDPLRPSNKIWVGGSEFAAPIIREAEALHLAPKCIDVRFGRDRRMDTCPDSVALGRQAVSVPPHRMQNIESTHALVSGNYVGRCIAFRMSDMQTFTGRVGKHVQHIEFGLGKIGLGSKSRVLFPVPLPLRLNSLRIVWHSAGSPRHRPGSRGNPFHSRECHGLSPVGWIFRRDRQ
jgi:hypothetical protein